MAEHLSPRRANDLGLFLPLSINLWLPEFYILNQHSLPQALVKIVELLDLFYSYLQGLGNGAARLPGGAAGRTIQHLKSLFTELFNQYPYFGLAVLAEWNIQRTLNASL